MNDNTTPRTLERVWTLDQLAEEIRIPKRTLNEWAREGALPGSYRLHPDTPRSRWRVNAAEAMEPNVVSALQARYARERSTARGAETQRTLPLSPSQKFVDAVNATSAVAMQNDAVSKACRCAAAVATRVARETARGMVVEVGAGASTVRVDGEQASVRDATPGGLLHALPMYLVLAAGMVFGGMVGAALVALWR